MCLSTVRVFLLLNQCDYRCMHKTRSTDAAQTKQQAIASEGLSQGPYAAARVGFEPATLRSQGTERTTAPTRPTI